MSAPDPWLSVYVRQGGKGLRKVADCVSDLLSLLKPGDSLLDAGCGRGDLLPLLPKSVIYTGVDLYQESIDEAKKYDGDFRLGNFMDEIHTYDVVWSSRTIIHLQDFKSAIMKLRSIAKRHCVLTCPVSEDKVTTMEVHGNTVWCREFSERTLRAIGECEIIKHPGYSTVIYS